MENSKSKSKDSAIKKPTPNKEITTYLQSKEYDNFINTMVSVVEKYGVEILEEIECAV